MNSISRPVEIPGPGKRVQLDRPGTGLEKKPAGGGRRRPGGDHIVYQKNPMALHALSHPETVLRISDTGGASKTGLLFAARRSPEGMDDRRRRVEPPLRGAGKSPRLIEEAAPVSRPARRNGHDTIEPVLLAFEQIFELGAEIREKFPAGTVFAGGDYFPQISRIESEKAASRTACKAGTAAGADFDSVDWTGAEQAARGKEEIAEIVQDRFHIDRIGKYPRMFPVSLARVIGHRSQ